MIKRLGQVAVLALAATIALPATGQSIDPRVLSQVQSQLGAGGQQGSALDRARETEQRPSESDLAAQRTGKVDTAEEQELRRLQSRAAIARLYRPSPIEREFQDRLSDRTLRQFGYELFQSVTGSSGPLTGTVSDSYIVGPGDEIVVQFQGATNDSRTTRVDREGRLVVGAVPPIQAAGRSLGAIRNDLAAATRRTLLGTDVYVSLGSARSATVFVGGEVVRPGQFQLTSLSDISAALAQAGGIRRTGSLRTVRVVHAGGGTVVVDLYGLLGIGSPPAIRLRDGDRIIVPVIGDTVAIAGNVARPGIYESRKGTTVGALLDYAGGALRPRGNAIAISRINPDGSEQFVRSAALASAVIPGDAVQLTSGSAGGAAGRVQLRGFVANPGPRSLGSAPTVRDLLGEVRDLRLDTYLPMAVLIRRDPNTSSRVFEPINLLSALTTNPVPLRSDDRLFVFSRADIDFMNRNVVRRIILGQPNNLTQCSSLERLQALVGNTQSSRFNAVTRGTFIVERAGRSDVAAVGGLQSNRRGDEALRTEGDQYRVTPNGSTSNTTPDRRLAVTGEQAALADVDSQAPDNTSDDQRDDTRDTAYTRDPTLSSGTALRSTRDPRQCAAVFEEEPELLPVLIENSVSVGGSIRRPGAYPIAGSETARDLAAAAEGLLVNASRLTLDVTRSDGDTSTQERIAPGVAADALSLTRVSAGDDLRFNGSQPQSEPGGVLLTGEFARPGLYSIRKGETLSQLMARAGGLSTLAYPYGTIFTRRSVKELQQEGFRRTGRELTNGLLAASSRKTGQTGDSLLAAQSLISQLSSAEAPGRVVVEADPRVLGLRPDLDTVLESGDAIYVPKRPNFVLALGDVNNPGALQFISGKYAKDYLAETGGTQWTADEKRIFVVLPNGSSQPLRKGRWARSGAIGVIPPGSTIIVPKNIDPLFTLDVARDVTSIVGTLFSSLATLAILATN
ncbi:SLBB domain-containing protein [Sphingosinicellaceae bacterium]|nr:SLBB domain-containing protein [Sphingosinicellaceae bacterium]